MNVEELIAKDLFEVVNEGEHRSREITKPFCCDLLSIAMGKAPAGGAWITVMANVNTLAVATLTEVACLILAEGVKLDEDAILKAEERGITVLATTQPIYDTAKLIDSFL